MWQAMAANMDMQSIRRDLPEEFWEDFDNIVANLERIVRKFIEHVQEVGAFVVTGF